MSKTEADSIEKPNALEVELISDRCQGYVKRYRSNWNKTVEHFIAVATTVKEAEDKLSKSELRVFCNQVNLDIKGSTYRKLMAIAEKEKRLTAHADRLPANWTTLYELARTSEVGFKTLVDQNVLKPDMTNKDLKAALDGEANASKPKAKKQKATKAASKADENKPLVAQSQEAAVDVAMASPENAEDRVEIALPDFSRAVDAGDLGRVHNETVLIDLRNVSVSDCIAFVATLPHSKKGYGLDYTLGAKIRQIWEDAGEEGPKRPLPEGFVPTDYMAVLQQA